MAVKQVVLGDAVRRGTGQNGVALQEVTMAARRRSAVARVLGDLVRTDARSCTVQKTVVLRRGLGVPMKQLRGGRGREGEGRNN